MLKIGGLKIKTRFILAPMAGITDFPFRMFCRGYGCQVAFTEMINVRSLSHKSKKTRQMLFSDKKDRPLGVQILGCEEKYILKGLDVLKKYEFDLLDVNAACPVRKVIRRGEGAALLKDLKHLEKILKLVIANSRAPVTLKIRTGWDRHCVNAPDVGLLAQDCGIKAIFIHGRTKEQAYSGQVDYKPIAETKKAVDIPVIGSGDVFSDLLAKKMFDETGCDALSVARGALGNPWIFKELDAFFKDAKSLARPELGEIKKAMVKHVDAYSKFYDDKVAVILFRKFFSWYTKGLRKIRPLREKISRIKKKEELLGLINQLHQ